MTDTVPIEEQRRRARRAALFLGAVALCMYVGFILSTAFRH